MVVRSVRVHVFQSQSDVSISALSVRRLVRDFNLYAECSADEVSIHFVDKEEICRLHEEYFQDATPTDCISFPMDENPEHGYRMMGDIFVCPAVAQEYVSTHGGDCYTEITLYVIHGLLHLQGFDDLAKEERRKMRAAEAEYLARVKNKNLFIKELRK